VKAQQQQLPMATLECDDPRLEQVARHVVVELALSRTHRILEQTRLTVDKRLLEKLLGLTAQRALHDDTQALAQLQLLPVRQLTVICPAKHFAKRREVAEQRTHRIHVLHERPELGETVLDRCRCQQQHRDLTRLQHLTDTPGHERLRRIFQVVAVLVEALVHASKDLVRLIDHAQIKRLRRQQRGTSPFAARLFSTDQEHTIALEAGELRLPLFRDEIE
jgi:hypothetical protein